MRLRLSNTKYISQTIIHYNLLMYSSLITIISKYLTLYTDTPLNSLQTFFVQSIKERWNEPGHTSHLRRFGDDKSYRIEMMQKIIRSEIIDLNYRQHQCLFK